MDRISGLPDEVLSHILSFLPTKLAALTSVLSTKWRNLFAYVPNIDITSHNKIVQLDGSCSCVTYDAIRMEDMYKTMRSFVDFMDRVLALQGDFSIKKVSLKCKNYVHPDDLNFWIRNVLRRGVSEIDLFIFREDGRDDLDYLLPQEMFLSRTLVKLKLSNVRWWPGAEGTFLPKLKTLVISRDLDCKDKLEMLLPAFPLLEELYIKKILWKPSGDSVSSASLKKLTIHAEGCENMIVHIPQSMSISFDTPSLLYLEYFDEVAKDYPKVYLPNLVEAVLDLNIRDYIILHRERNDDGLRNYVVMRCGNLWKLMSGIRHVKTLTLSCVTLEIFSLCFETMPVFNNLKMLRIRIRSCSSQGWQAMPVLLKNCPNLETLHIKRLFLWDSISLDDKDLWLTSCPVKKIQIESYGGSKGEMRMVKHLLESFPSLKEMELFALKNYHKDIFDLIVKMVNLFNESYRVVVFNSWCVIHRINELDS